MAGRVNGVEPKRLTSMRVYGGDPSLQDGEENVDLLLLPRTRVITAEGFEAHLIQAVPVRIPDAFINVTSVEALEDG